MMMMMRIMVVLLMLMLLLLLARPMIDDGVGGLVVGLQLAREDRLVELQRRDLDQPQVGRHAIADVQQHDVARHQLLGAYLEHMALAQHVASIDRQSAQRRHALLRAVLLIEAHDVDDHHRDEDADRVRELARHERDHRRREQQHHERLLELPQEPQHERLVVRLAEQIVAVAV